jgi:microcompartment protein CcmL/EutN
MEITIGLLEYNSIVAGMFSADQMVKKAPVKIIECRTICPGKYMVLICGDVASVDESLKIGKEVAGVFLVDRFFLPNAHTQILPAITGTRVVESMEAFGAVETFTAASTILAADKAVKAAPVELIEIRLANGLGGKSFFTMSGDLDLIEAAVEAATMTLKEEGLLVNRVIIPRPHPDFAAKMI